MNGALDKKSAELDDERAALSKALEDYSAGMLLEQTIRGINVELAQLQAADVGLHKDIVAEVRKLEQLEKEV